MNAVGVGAGDYLTWDGNQWSTGTTTVSIGRGAGNVGDSLCVSIGNNAGTTANSNSVAIGNGAGVTATGGSVAIGTGAGTPGGSLAVAIGSNAGTSGGNFSVAVGVSAGIGCGSGAVCVGNSTVGGTNSVSIGDGAANTNVANNAIVISALGGTLGSAGANTCKIAPIRNSALTPATYTASSAGSLTYNNTTKEVCFDATSFKCSTITAPLTLPLPPTVNGTTYIVLGSGTLTLTNTLAVADNGFFVNLKNGTNGGADITLAGVAGATTLHRASGSTNGQSVILFWNGSALTAY